MQGTALNFTKNDSIMEKENVIRKILSVCNDLNLSVKTKVKTDKWKADIVVDYLNYSVAFNVCKNPRNMKETYMAMRKERVCGCWLVLQGKISYLSPGNLPCFAIEDTNDNVQVYLNKVWEESTVLSSYKLLGLH